MCNEWDIRYSMCTRYSIPLYRNNVPFLSTSRFKPCRPVWSCTKQMDNRQGDIGGKKSANLLYPSHQQTNNKEKWYNYYSYKNKLKKQQPERMHKKLETKSVPLQGPTRIRTGVAGKDFWHFSSFIWNENRIRIRSANQLHHRTVSFHASTKPGSATVCDMLCEFKQLLNIYRFALNIYACLGGEWRCVGAAVWVLE